MAVGSLLTGRQIQARIHSATARMSAGIAGANDALRVGRAEVKPIEFDKDNDTYGKK